MAYIIVIIAALFHAVWNSMIKGSGDQLMTLAAIRSVGLVFGLAVMLIMPPLAWDALPYLGATVVFCYLYFWFLLNAYRVGDFSQVYPIARGSAPLIVMLLGVVFAKEYLSFAQILATILISMGILLLSFVKARMALLPLGYALGTALTIAGYTVVSGMGVRISGSFIVYAGWLEATTGIGVVLFALLKRRRKLAVSLSQHWRQGGVAGLLSVSAFASVLWAMTKAPLAPIAALRETSVIFAALIGTLLFKEGLSYYRVPAACIVAAGIALLVN